MKFFLCSKTLIQMNFNFGFERPHFRGTIYTFGQICTYVKSNAKISCRCCVHSGIAFFHFIFFLYYFRHHLRILNSGKIENITSKKKRRKMLCTRYCIYLLVLRFFFFLFSFIFFVKFFRSSII